MPTDFLERTYTKMYVCQFILTLLAGLLHKQAKVSSLWSLIFIEMEIDVRICQCVMGTPSVEYFGGVRSCFLSRDFLFLFFAFLEGVYWIDISMNFKRLFRFKKVLWYSIKIFKECKTFLWYSIRIFKIF